MEHILVVSGSEQGYMLLQQLLQKLELQVAQHAFNGLEARNFLKENVFDLVLINTPLPDEYGEAVAKTAYEQGASVILLVKNEHADAVWERIQQTGIYLLLKPLKKVLFFQTIQCVLQQEKKLLQLQQERDKLSWKMQEIHLINRAKLLLIQVLKLSEAQAHRYIEKQAMDLRITKREVAEGIINTYEN